MLEFCDRYCDLLAQLDDYCCLRLSFWGICNRALTDCIHIYVQ